MLCSAYKQNISFPVFQWIVVKTTVEQILSKNHPHCDSKELMEILQNVLFVSIAPKVGGFPSAHHSQVLYKREILALIDDYVHSNNHTNQTFPNDVTQQPHEFPDEVYINKGPHSTELSAAMVYSNTTRLLEAEEESKVFLISTDPYIVLYVAPFPLGMFFLVLNNFFLLLYALLFIATLINRKHAFVRKSSLPLLFQCYIGIVFINVTLTIYFIQKSVSIPSDKLYVSLCWVFRFIHNTGATLMLGVVAIKLWRLYRVFVHYLNPGSCLTDNHLVVAASCLTLIDLIICALWFILDPLHRKYIMLSRDNFRAQVEYRTVCSSKAVSLLWLLLWSYKYLIMILIVVLLMKLKSQIPMAHKRRLQSTGLQVLWYLTFLIITIGIPAYMISHFLINNTVLEVIAAGTIFLSIQGLCVAYILFPPLWPVLNTYKLNFIKT